MPAERYYVNEDFRDGKTVAVEDLEFHHLCNVMRTKIGQHVELVNGKSFLAQAVVQEIKKNKANLLIISVEQTPPTKSIILAQALPRFNRLEFILEKSTELGVSEFWLFPGDLSEKTTISSNQEKRMFQIALAAMKQCGRLDLPLIKILPSLSEWQATPNPSLYGDTRKNAPFLWKLPNPSPDPSDPVYMFIGPEKGFSVGEIEILENKYKSQGVRIHPNILRVDTAPVAAIALLQSILL